MQRNRPKKFHQEPVRHPNLRKRWQHWLPRMSTDLSQLLGKREIFWELQDVVKENPQILENDTFFDWMCTNYIAAASIGVRSFTDQSKDSHSLWRMLYEILEHPRIINRITYKKLYRSAPKSQYFDMADSAFNNLVGMEKSYLSQKDVRRDLRILEDASERVRKFTNKRVAHRTPLGEIKRLPTFDELDQSMDTIDKIFCKYNNLLAASGMSSTFATRQYDWKESLHEPWVKVGSKFRLP